MIDFWSQLFSSNLFVPHGHCYLWQTNLVSLHVLSDALIALAYYSIPITLFYLVRKRQDLPFEWVFLLFATFIVACGTTHVLEIWTLWYPTYWLSGLVKALTALVSVITATQLFPLMPKVLSLPSPAQLEHANFALQSQVTERLRVEEELKRYQNQLESLVAERTNELTQANQTLQQEITERKRVEAERKWLLAQEQAVRAEAEQANRLKDEFLAVLSHELRTPMNPILGWSSLLKRGKLDAAKMAQAIATIERNAKLQVQLIDDLLDISRILHGKLTLTIESVDLSTVVSTALETVRLAAEAKSLQIQTVIPPSMAFVDGDPGRLQQVVWNLLSNAIKFTPEQGQISIVLTIVGTTAQIQIRDTGKGISPEFLPYIFKHFRQEDGATTRKFGGLGLGLAIVRQIVELHGGTVAVNSPGEGRGATFLVQIPLATRLSEMPSLGESLVSTRSLSGIHILVVDDEPDSREVIQLILEQANAIVTSVSSGIEALQTISQSVPDLVLSDIGMPEMDGYMLLQRIRAMEQGTQIPVIALTAYAGEFERQQAIVGGFQQHIPKPVEPEKLVSAVYALCKGLSASKTE